MSSITEGRRNRLIAGAFILVLAIVSYFVFTSGSIGSTATLLTSSGAHRISVEIADTPESRATGLMNRNSMDEDHGMLFDFGESRDVSMWMKNTLIPLDMIFIRQDGTVARIARHATPLSLTPIPSGEPVRYVLELNGGAAAGYGVEPGDRVHHPLVGNGAK
ncbi:hypothetical protein SAMN02745911_2663 [Aureimonas altamirensis DSM 21988]|uniref:DUF192 domain-containing protein n=1 Tax=Aureimonas altamirensis DSM 21988 TaxID=1121026 RepID=A0ABY1IMQ5_9HYPH|nr:DUF192 domain-containing protein [Aureimonas altamirensis]SHJ49419.1 hypothetical protein SAMN02745911_2663 [Aureimonas altamirensis DSM 21988]